MVNILGEGKQMDVIQIARERRAALLREAEILERFIETAKALIAQAKAAAPPADSETTESVADATVADSFVFDTPPIPQLPKIMPEALRPIDKALFQQILAETRRQHNTALPQQRKAAG